MSATKLSVFLIDDHPIVAAGLRLGFDLTEDIRLVGDALSHHEALDRLSGLKPDVIISDLVIDGELDLTFFELYREAVPTARIIAFSSLAASAYADKCVAAGADGFVSKTTSPHELVAAIRSILDQAETPNLRETSSSVEPESVALDGIRLTTREAEVANLLARGLSVNAIGDVLGISKKTVSIHRDNLRGKLNCATSGELIALLARNMGSEV